MHRRLIFTLALATPARDAAAPSYPAVPLLAIGSTIVGENIRYPKGDTHITAAIVTLAPGARTILHKHPVPLFAYILEAGLAVNYDAHGTHIYQQPLERIGEA
jgi:quercetin dioxygenase-like cupin family protein